MSAPEPQAGADEAEQAAQEWIDAYGMPDSLEAVADLIRTKEAAGRARGIEEGPLAEAHELLREFMLTRQCLCSATHGGLAVENHYKGCRALSLLRRIADAIAKETP